MRHQSGIFPGFSELAVLTTNGALIILGSKQIYLKTTSHKLSAAAK